MCNDDTTEPEIRDLEMIDWVKNGEDLPTMAFRDGKIVENRYVTFKELFDAISEFGPLVHKNEIATLKFMPLSDEFEDDIMAVRASGRNIRRFLLREDTFESAFDDFQGCIDHLISNNTVECELEVRHIYDMAEKLNLLSMAPEPGRQYDRLEIDLIAALQLMHVKEKIVKDTGGPEFLFELGFSVGRLFSSAQNLATLEDDAQKAGEYEASYRSRGKKGKSDQRKNQRQIDLFVRIKKLVSDNPSMSRLKPLVVAKIAAEDAAKDDPKLWSQGMGQLESYLTTYASDEPYKQDYRKLFPKTG